MLLLLFPFRLLLVAFWVVLGLLSVTLLFPVLPLSVRGCMIRHWSRALMVLCGVNMRLTGYSPHAGAVLWVANHVSWVDIFVLNAVRPTAFIAKSDIRRWPVIGWLVAGAGTVFIERGKRHAVRAVGQQMQQRFARGEVIGLFPEGTTSPGFDVAPFHTSLFDPAIRAGVDIQPVALRFFHQGRRSDRVAFVGDQNLVQNLWFLLTSHDVVVELDFQPVLDHAWCVEQGRARVAVHAHALVQNAVRPPGVHGADMPHSV